MIWIKYLEPNKIDNVNFTDNAFPKFLDPICREIREEEEEKRREALIKCATEADRVKTLNTGIIDEELEELAIEKLPKIKI